MPSTPLDQFTTASQPYFCDDPVGIEHHDRRSLNPEERRQVRELEVLDPSHNWRILLFFAMWFAAVLLMTVSESTLLRVPLVIIAGFCVSALPVFMHEGCHGTLHKNPRYNRWLGFSAGLPGLVAVSAYRAVHLVHHANTRTERDPDDVENFASLKLLPLLFVGILFAGIYIYIFSVPFVGFRHANREMQRRILLEYIIILSVLAVVLATIPLDLVLWGWALPLVVAGQLANVRGLAEHGLTSPDSPFTDTRTVLSNRFVSFFMSNLNYHIEHHFFPAVPWYNLPRLHDLLQPWYARTGASVYNGYLEFLRDLSKASATGLFPKGRLLPKHVIEEYCA